ncbi:MAG: hypothetical protein DMF19_06570, partial [Verrucomicrobia bacterium]
MTIRRRRFLLQCDSILADDLDAGIRDRTPALNRHQKNIATAAGTFLRQNSNVGDEKKKGLPHRGNYLALDRVPAAGGEEKEPALAPAVDWLAEML